MKNIEAVDIVNIKNRVGALYRTFGANKATASIEKVTRAIVEDFERFPALPATLDTSERWNYYIIQTAFSIVA